MMGGAMMAGMGWLVILTMLLFWLSVLLPRRGDGVSSLPPKSSS
jgi:hypothetical protein